jgi:hypothetical protein
MKEIYIQCDCGAEILRIEHESEDKQYYISIYKLKGIYSIFNKLRWIWRIIRLGEPY